MKKTVRALDLRPIDTAVIVELEPVEENTKGGIFLPARETDRELSTQTEGVLFRIGDAAFWELKSKKLDYPKVGEVVYFKSFSGILVKEPKELGKRAFRVMNDIDLYTINDGELIEVDIKEGV